MDTVFLRSTKPARAVPWYLWCAALAVTSAYVGGYWDIAWHRSIGRDTFWTPPHIAIYACGILAGVASAYLIAATTFRRDAPLGPVSVRIWGLRAPLGAFISAWGGIAMLASAPFDDWWHNAYGLDVKIISPPHMVLASGFFGIELGTILLLAAFMNRATSERRAALRRVFLYVSGVAFSESLLLKLEYIDRSDMHTPLFFIVVMIGTPALLTIVSLVSHDRWACTKMALIYSAFGVLLLWILPFVPAEPKLGPVYIPVTHLIPWEFPLLLVVPAAILDTLLAATAAWRPLVRAAIGGVAFFVVFLAVQWPFADFLQSPLARNRVFGSQYMGYYTRPGSAYTRYEFFPSVTGAPFWAWMSVAALTACGMIWIGIHAGRAMQRVRR